MLHHFLCLKDHEPLILCKNNNNKQTNKQQQRAKSSFNLGWRPNLKKVKKVPYAGGVLKFAFSSQETSRCDDKICFPGSYNGLEEEEYRRCIIELFSLQ